MVNSWLRTESTYTSPPASLGLPVSKPRQCEAIYKFLTLFQAGFTTLKGCANQLVRLHLHVLSNNIRLSRQTILTIRQESRHGGVYLKSSQPLGTPSTRGSIPTADTYIADTKKLLSDNDDYLTYT